MSFAHARRRFVAAGVVGLVGLLTVLAGVARSSATANLLKNGGADLGTGVATSENGSGVVKSIPGWVRTGNFTVVKYGSPGGFPSIANSQTIAGGRNFFAGGPSNPNSGATQTVNVAGKAAAIDASKLSATLAAYLGGYSNQRDSLAVSATFLNASGKKLGGIRVGPVTPAQRKIQTTLIAKSATAKVPPKTRSIRVALTATRTDGAYNDGYADNLTLTLTTG